MVYCRDYRGAPAPHLAYNSDRLLYMLCSRDLGLSRWGALQ
jgi:hypothetical protein